MRRGRYFYLRLLLLPDTPRRVARGLGAGVFVGCLPIIPVQTVVAVALAGIIRGSLLLAAAGTWVTNPLTVAPLYALFFYLGRTLTPFGRNAHLPADWNVQSVLGLGMDVILATLIGGFILGLIFGPLAYGLSLKYVDRLQSWERRKLREKFVLPPPTAE